MEVRRPAAWIGTSIVQGSLKGIVHTPIFGVLYTYSQAACTVGHNDAKNATPRPGPQSRYLETRETPEGSREGSRYPAYVTNAAALRARRRALPPLPASAIMPRVKTYNDISTPKFEPNGWCMRGTGA